MHSCYPRKGGGTGYEGLKTFRQIYRVDTTELGNFRTYEVTI